MAESSGKATLKEFISKVRTEGLLTATHYFVRIGSADKSITMMCDSVNLPGMSIGTTDVRIFGENREVPYMPLYPALDLSFILDREMKTRTFFEDWANQVVNRKTRNVGFYKDYANKEIDIIVTDKAGKAVHCTRLYGAFPKAIQDIRLGFDAEEVIKLNVTMSFKYWETIQVSENGEPLANKNISSGSTAETLGNSTGSPVTGTQTPTTGDVAKDATAVGSKFGSDVMKSTSATAALLGSSPNGNTNTNAMMSGLLAVGKTANDMGAKIGELGRNINEFAAPVAAVANSVSAISGTLNALNGITSALGLGTPFSGAVSKLNGTAGKLSAVGQLRGLPGALGSLGSSMSAVNSAFSVLSGSVGQTPWGTDKIAESFKGIGAAFANGANGVSGVGSTIQGDITSGKSDGSSTGGAG